MESSSKGSRRLADLCTDLLALTVQIRAGGDPGGAEEVRRRTDRGLYRVELEAREAGFPGEWVEAAKYALCAFLDESILVSTLPFRDDWSAKPLQLELFGERLAGEGFFKRLTEMGRRMAEMEQVIEVYYLCLSLGFEGRYRVEGVERLRQLTTDLASDLAKLRKGGDELSPPPPPEGGGIAGQIGRRLPPWVALAVSGAVLVMLYSSYAVLLHREAAHLPLAAPATEVAQ
jgi:type VI secretion system protein ImpK